MVQQAARCAVEREKMNRKEAIERAARYIYVDKGNRVGVNYVGWDNEPEEVKDKWRLDVRTTITAYEYYLNMKSRNDKNA